MLFIALLTADGGVATNTIFFLDNLTCEHTRGLLIAQFEAIRKPKVSYIAVCIQTDSIRR